MAVQAIAEKPNIKPQLEKGTTSRGTTRLLVVDTWSNEDIGIIADLFPKASFHNIRTPFNVSSAMHSHGHSVAYSALSQIHPEKKVEVYFYRVFDSNGHPYRKFDTWIDAMADLKPDATVCSFGTHHGNSTKQRQMLDRIYEGKYADKLCNAIYDSGCTVFAASGNEDSSKHKPDFDNDVNYPWRVADCPNLAVIGAVFSNHSPAYFSSDGSQVDSAWLGVQVPVVLPNGGKAKIDGTSFAAPIAAGYFLDNGFKDFAEFDKFCYRYAYRVDDWDHTQRHPKVGWGSMLAYQREMMPFDSAPQMKEWESR